MKLTGENRSTRGKTCPSATLFTTNLTWTDPGSDPDLRGGRPATNRLSHGTVPQSCLHHNAFSRYVFHLLPPYLPVPLISNYLITHYQFPTHTYS
jgi:hypothetical protein